MKKLHFNLRFQTIKIITAAILIFSFVLTATAGCKSNTLTEAETHIVINEILPSDALLYKNGDGVLCGYVEIFNDSFNGMNLDGCSVYIDGHKAYTFPRNSAIAAHGCVVVNFGGSAEGECDSFERIAPGCGIVLRNPREVVIDEVVLSEKLRADECMLRNSDGLWEASSGISPKQENSDAGRALYESELASGAEKGIEISEVMAVNHTTLRDGNGSFSDYIELYNSSASSIDLGNYTLTDDEDVLYKWHLPRRTLAPGEYMLLFASGNTADGDEYAPFKLSSKGEKLILCDGKGKTVQILDVPAADADEAYSVDGNGEYHNTYDATPGFANTQGGIEGFKKSLPAVDSDLLIWEVMSKNNKEYMAQSNGKYYDWIELKNVSDKTIDLSSYSISDDNGGLNCFTLPAKELKSGEFAVIICSGNEALTTKDYIHSNFKINGDECVFLYHDGNIVDGVCAKMSRINTTVGRIDGNNYFSYLSAPTPGYENSATGRKAYERKNGTKTIAWAEFLSVAEAPETNTAGGVYNNSEPLNVRLTGEGDIYYALYYSDDGGKTSSATKYSLYDREKGIDIKKTTTIRAYSVAEGKMTSDIMSVSYVINENHSIDVLCVSVDYDDMWSDERGIYVKGTGSRENYKKGWEREAFASFYCADGSEGFEIPCGLKIFGGESKHLPKKSFQLKFRSMYGEGSLKYDVFGDGITEFESLVLRSGSQDYDEAMLRDEWLTSVTASGCPSVIVQSYRPIILYVNGAYFGIYYMREQTSADYISKKLNVSKESVNIVECNHRLRDGTNEDYVALLDYVRSHDLSKDEYYEYVCSKIDLTSFIDYKIAEFFSGNQDTGNVRFCMSKEYDGKWRWILYDLDYAFYYYSKLYKYTTEYRPGYYEVNLLSKNLIKNKKFVDAFCRRCAELFTTTYSYDNVVGMLDKLAATIEPEMERNCKRWGTDFQRWGRVLENLRHKVKVKLAMEKYYYKSDEMGYNWSLYYQIKEEFNLSNKQFLEYYGDVFGQKD